MAEQRVAYDRLRETARRLCRQIEDMRSLGHQPAYIKCVDETLANALQQVKARALAAVEKSRAER
jgi:UrcA family protein